MLNKTVNNIVMQNTDNLKFVELQAENRLLRSENERLLIARNDLFLELEKYQGFKKQLRMLLVTTHSRLERKIEAIAYVSKSSYPNQNIDISTASYEELLESVKAYDKSVLVERRIIGPRWRRILSELLLKMLKLPKAFMKLIIRSLRFVKRTLS